MTTPQNDKILYILRHGEIEVKGEFMWGSNYTFLTEVQFQGDALTAVYKPSRGERPLWDFPAASLARREVAAYLISEALGWHFVPPTIYRGEAPIGPGSLQLFIDHDPEYHYFNLNEADRQRLRPVALFDLLINNADRKGSHILFDSQAQMWLIDHGICFHADNKLRTVIWDFAGEQIPEALCADLKALREKLGSPSSLVEALQEHLSPREVAALVARADHLIARIRFPDPHPNRRPYPWPPI